MATAACNGLLKVWDLRTYQTLHIVKMRPITCIDYSQLGLISISQKGGVKIWKDATTMNKHPYLVHSMPTADIYDLHFCPYDDVLGISHMDGFSRYSVVEFFF